MGGRVFEWFLNRVILGVISLPTFCRRWEIRELACFAEAGCRARQCQQAWLGFVDGGVSRSSLQTFVCLLHEWGANPGPLAAVPTVPIRGMANAQPLNLCKLGGGLLEETIGELADMAVYHEEANARSGVTLSPGDASALPTHESADVCLVCMVCKAVMCFCPVSAWIAFGIQQVNVAMPHSQTQYPAGSVQRNATPSTHLRAEVGLLQTGCIRSP